MIDVTVHDKNGLSFIDPERFEEWMLNLELPKDKLNVMNMRIDMDIPDPKLQAKAVKLIMMAMREAGLLIRQFCKHEKFDIVFTFNPKKS